MKQKWANILLVAGSGQNSGKTTFICELLQELKSYRAICVKITHHFYEPTPGLKLIAESPYFQLFEETNNETNKDSSRYLQSGAYRSFYAQAKKEHLMETFIALLPYLEADQPIIFESAAMHFHIDAGIFALIVNENSEQKPSTEINRKVADVIVRSDGKRFSPKSSAFFFHKEWRVTT